LRWAKPQRRALKAFLRDGSSEHWKVILGTRIWLWRLLLLQVLLFLICAYGWESGERLQVQERFIYENF
jgi:hypothetical protein